MSLVLLMSRSVLDDRVSDQRFISKSISDYLVKGTDILTFFTSIHILYNEFYKLTVCRLTFHMVQPAVLVGVDRTYFLEVPGF